LAHAACYDTQHVSAGRYSRSHFCKRYQLDGMDRIRGKHFYGISCVCSGTRRSTQCTKATSLVVPRADQVTRQQLLVILQGIERAARTLYGYNREDMGKNVRLHVLMHEVYTLDEFSKKILRRVDLYEERLPKFRDEIEEYFNE
jgi:hypothetical protein